MSRLRKIRFTAALTGATFGLVIVFSSLLPGAPHLPDGVEWIPFVLAFPIFGWAVIERAVEQASLDRGKPRTKWYERGMQSNEELNRYWTNLGVQLHKYRGILSIIVPLVAALWILGVVSIASSQGQPIHSGNQYYLDDHGSHIPVTRAGYESAIALQERTFATGGTGFLILASAMTMTFRSRKTATP